MRAERTLKTLRIQGDLRVEYKDGLFPPGLFTVLGLKHNLTRSRIEQVASRLFPDRIKTGDIRLKHPCLQCGILISKHRKFCCRDHSDTFIRERTANSKCNWCGLIPPRSKGFCEPCYQRFRYHNLPGVKERHAVHVKNWISKPGVREIRYRKHKEWLQRVNYYQRPEVKARLSVAGKAYYLKRRHDPVRWAQYLETAKEKRRQKIIKEKLEG